MDFERSYAAYKEHLTETLGREPTREEIMKEMARGGWMFEDSSGPITVEDL